MGPFLLLTLLIGLPQVSWAQVPLALPDIEVAPLKNSGPRSIAWPTQSSPAPPMLMLPQVDEAINTLSGLQARTQGSPTFSIRGSGQSGRALVLLNDVPLNFASGFGPPQIFLAKETISQIEVVKGPASLFYGSQALTGSLNFQTQKYDQAQLVLTLSDPTESFLPWRGANLSHNSLQLASPIYSDSKHHYQISLFNETDDGLFPFDMDGKTRFRHFNSQNLNRFVFEGESRSDSWIVGSQLLMGRHIRQSPGPVTTPLPTREESEGLLVSLKPHYFINDNLSLKSQLSFLETQSEFQDANDVSQAYERSFILQNEWLYEWSKNSQLQIFMDGFDQRLDNSFIGERLSQSQWEVGPFVSHQPQGHPLVYKLGGRYLPTFDQFLSTAAIHYPLNQSEFWLSFGEGFRNPSLSDLYSQTPFFQGNPNLLPERSMQWELGWRWQTDLNFASWSQEVRLFQIDYDNFLETFEMEPGLFSRENQGQGRTRGFDWEMALGHQKRRGYLSYNYLDSRNANTGQVFRLAPRHQLTWGAQAQFFKTHQFELQNTIWTHNFDIVNNEAVRLDDWSQWNLFWTWECQDNLSLRLGVINATNTQRELTLGFPEPGRRYWMQWMYVFDPQSLF